MSHCAKKLTFPFSLQCILFCLLQKNVRTNPLLSLIGFTCGSRTQQHSDVHMVQDALPYYMADHTDSQREGRDCRKWGRGKGSKPCQLLIGAVVRLGLAETQLLLTRADDSRLTHQITVHCSLRAHQQLCRNGILPDYRHERSLVGQCTDSARRTEGQPEEAALRVRGRRQGARWPPPSGGLLPLSQGKSFFQPCVNSHC